jgi:hypothetical protein
MPGDTIGSVVFSSWNYGFKRYPPLAGKTIIGIYSREITVHYVLERGLLMFVMLYEYFDLSV